MNMIFTQQRHNFEVDDKYGTNDPNPPSPSTTTMVLSKNMSFPNIEAL
jgi:hypothetical protein